MVDFELAVKQAYERTSPGVLVKGCLFHFGQSLFKNVVRIGPKTEYLEIEDFRLWFKKGFCLALIPSVTIESEAVALRNQLLNDIVPEHPAITASKASKYWQYFITAYFEGQYPKTMWCHFDTSFERTNNRVEGDNNKMKQFCGSANPHIDKAIGLLQQYETTSSDKYNNAIKSTAKAHYTKNPTNKYAMQICGK
jgi:hypothetical protein